MRMENIKRPFGEYDEQSGETEGSQRGHHNKYMGSRYREWDDHLKSQYENIDGHRGNSTHRKRDRDHVMNEQKGYEQTRIKEDNHYSSKHKEEGWFQRSESLKEQDEWHVSHDETLLKRERVARWGGMRSRQAVEDKAWITREKDGYKGSAKDYQLKDTGRQSETGNDRSFDDSNGHGAHDKTSKDNARKSKESKGRAHNPSGYCKRNQEDIGGQINEKRGSESQGKYSMRCDDVSQRGHHNKYMGSRYREWDDHLRSQYENIDGIEKIALIESEIEMIL
ncbi:uncharacterized protein LOC132279743 [Cornus florida]|uniref:uncharacterized protein LOC132279743 n=1 Tax=Cornus florida TaxID=4283 RepID=UPI002897E943|nr:uncharacterized protein LOC132279743 [Cornus florida]